MTTTVRSRQRRALLLGSAVGLLLGELLVRLWVGAPLPERLPLEQIQADAASGWGMVPDSDHFTYQHPVHVNHLGLRGGDVPAAKGDEWRVLVLGDSMVYGQGVAEADTVPAQLERLLRARSPGRPVRVLNGGVRAYATAQELGMLQRLGATVQPDVVVLCWYHNDVDERDQERTYQRLLASGPITYDVDGRLDGAALWLWRGRQVLRSSALLMLAHDVVQARTTAPWSAAQQAHGLQRLDAGLDGFLQQQRTLGCRLLFVAVPAGDSLPGDSPLRDLTLRALAVARARGLEVVDPQAELAALYRRRGRLPVVPYDGHYDGEANAVLAAALAAPLLPVPAGR